MNTRLIREWLAERLRRRPPLVWILIVGLVVGYAAFLRVDCLFIKFGPYDHPSWLVSLERQVTRLHEPLTPESWTWPKVTDPYLGGDPVNYIRFAREMRHFYQGHVREPVFLAVTRVFFAVTDGQDVAVSFASIVFSVLAVWATYLLGSAIASRGVGVAAAFLLGIEREVIEWAPAGWRDDAFMAMVVLGAWALVHLHRRRTWTSAVLAGVIAAAAVLTRLSALSFLGPGFLAVLWLGREAWRAELKRVAVAVGVMTVLIAPYLINCYRDTGDAFTAVNYHTRFYQAAEGVSVSTETPPTAIAYVAAKFRERPVTATDTAARGLFAYPFDIKWRGFVMWLPWIGSVLSWLALGGLFLWAWQPVGRLVLIVLIGSLVPYMLTWPLRGGGEWRFTMHAYPFYLIAAVTFVSQILTWLARTRPATIRSLLADRAARIRGLTGVAAVVVIVAASLLEIYWAPALLAREALVAGEPRSIAVGERDDVFFREGWSAPVTSGAVTARLATSAMATLYVPLPESRPYQMVIRMDSIPHDRSGSPVVRVFVRSRLLAQLELTWDALRVGQHVVEIPAELAGRGLTPLEFMADDLQPLADAAPLFRGLSPDQPAAFRLWYVRLTPK